MNKKKVKTHVEDAIAFLDKLSNYVNGYNNNAYLHNAIKALDMAKAVFYKSDWISVEDRLPEFGERVYTRITNIDGASIYPVTEREKDGETILVRDYHKFVVSNMG